MNLKHAQYLEAIRKTGSITAAAAGLGGRIRRIALHPYQERDPTHRGRRNPPGELRQMKASYTLARDKIDALPCKIPQARLNLAVTTTMGLQLFPTPAS